MKLFSFNSLESSFEAVDFGVKLADNLDKTMYILALS
jgi:hypothetical protein